MEVCLDDRGLSGKDPTSFNSLEEDSNALILPKKQKDKRKCVDKEDKLHRGKKQKLSKSRKRKIKKLEEEKEKVLLLSKSLEALEKYKIPDEVFPLLHSSRNIGQGETRLEKRRRAVQFNKAGVESPVEMDLNERSGKNSFSENQPGNPELNNGVDPTQPMITKTEVVRHEYVSSDSYQGPDSQPQDKNGPESVVTLTTEEDTFGKGQSCMRQDVQNSSNDDPKILKSEDGESENRSRQTDGATKLEDSPSKRSVSAAAPIVVHVLRPDEVENKRKDLPIVMMEQEIMEAINDNSTVIICGETGCGKTTQVPQFLYEAGFGSSQATVRRGMIGVTQPRRVAVLATAKRVAYELGLHLGKEVGFQVRYDKKIGDSCSIKFMTDGILLREVQNDFLLKRYSIILLDEAHERSLNTDILIGMLSRIVNLRQDLYRKQQQMMLLGQTISPDSMVLPLKLVLMSATLRVEDFISGGRLFRVPPPVIEVPTRQFPVTVHFSKRTEVVDYVGQAYKKILAIHKKLPPGGILVFVTGQREVEYLCRKLRQASRDFVKKNSERNIGNDDAASPQEDSIEGLDMKDIHEAFEMDRNSTDQQTDRFSFYDEDDFDLDGEESDVSYGPETDSDLETVDDEVDSTDQRNPSDISRDGETLNNLKAAFEALVGTNALKCKSEGEHVDQVMPKACSDKKSQKEGKKKDEKLGFSAGALCVLPLYAMLPAESQLRVFEEVKEGERLVVVATNVAETSLTIPGIKYVVDTGREKVKTYNLSNGVETYDVQWISKASAAQRAGRAGRTGPGHCYRLYSSAVFSNILPDFSLAEIAKIPVDGVVLLMKSMGIDKVANFPFPTPPQVAAIVEAERCLKALEALDSNGRLTPLGKAMACYPMSPRHSRMLLTVVQLMGNVKSYDRANLVLAFAVAAAAALSLSNPFIMVLEGRQTRNDDSGKGEKSSEIDGEKVADKEEKSRMKKLKETVRLSRAKFLNPTSDALTLAYALQCFELSESPAGFCADNALHLKTMEEMSKLRKQLLQLVFTQRSVSAIGADYSWVHGTLQDVAAAWNVISNKHPLLKNEEELLGQAICAGWADRVAKRVRGASGPSDDRKAQAVRYQACVVKETVFLHRWSSVSSSAPEFLVYSELLHTKRPYMHGVTSVRPVWLVKYAGSLCTFSAPLADPRPYYEPQTDRVFCWVSPTFGPHLWELPLHNVPISDDLQRIAVFAYALLEGQVLPCLKPVRKFLAAPPSSILKPEAAGQKRVGNLLNRLKSLSIDSCATLRETWQENPLELHSEIRDWFQGGFHRQFRELWSQMLSEVLLEPQDRFPQKVKRSKRKM